MRFWQNRKEHTQINSKTRSLLFSPALFCRFYALLLLLFIGGVFLFRQQQTAREEKTRRHCREEAQMLVQAGFYGEAQKKLNAMPKPLFPEDEELLFQIALQKQDFRFAMDLLPNLSTKQEPASRLALITALQEAGKSVLAWKVLCETPFSKNESAEKALVISLLQDVRETPTRAVFVSGWHHHKAAIMRDEGGFFLVNTQGEERSDARYESLVPVSEGFCARKKEVWITLDVDGNFVKTTVEPEEKDIIEADPSFLLMPTEEEGVQGYSFDGEEVIKPIYDRASPISVNGIGYVETEGRCWQIRFRALHDGVSFNKIES